MPGKVWWKWGQLRSWGLWLPVLSWGSSVWEKSLMGVHLETPEAPSNHVCFMILCIFKTLFLFLNYLSVSVVLPWLSVNPSRWGAVLGSVGCSSGNSTSLCPFPLLRHFQEGLSWSKMWLEEGRGMLKCFGRMSKTLETLINSHFSLFAAFLLERQKEGRECDSWQMGCEDL